jgi:hypothetical protein
MLCIASCANRARRLFVLTHQRGSAGELTVGLESPFSVTRHVALMRIEVNSHSTVFKIDYLVEALAGEGV